MLLNCSVREDFRIPWPARGSKPVSPGGNQPWIFIGRTNAKAEAPVLWPLDVKNWLTGKDPDAGKDWRQEKKRMTETEKVGWHHWLNGHEFEQTLGDGEGQGSLECCNQWVAKSRIQQSDWTMTILPSLASFEQYYVSDIHLCWCSVAEVILFPCCNSMPRYKCIIVYPFYF